MIHLFSIVRRTTRSSLQSNLYDGERAVCDSIHCGSSIHCAKESSRSSLRHEEIHNLQVPSAGCISAKGSVGRGPFWHRAGFERGVSDLAIGVPGRSSNAPHIVSQATFVVEEIPDAFLH